MEVDPGPFVNRLRKNLRTVGRWARRGGVTCYRLYDADIPEYAVALDLYQTEGPRGGLHVHLQEYAAPATVDAELAQARLTAAVRGAGALLDVPRARVHVKVRRRQRGAAQYERRRAPGDEGAMHEVREGSCRLLVNFTDYLDTGLFLDHRLVRAQLGALARGKRVLNLFAYTASASVHAALGQADETTSVDASTRYCAWARQNLALNGLDPRAHRVVRSDALAYVQDEPRGRYELAFVDPPTFSNARGRATFDVQRDHVALLRATLRALTPDGLLIFSCNRRAFKLDESGLRAAVDAEPGLDRLDIEDVSRASIPRDFARNQRIHRCWQIRRGRDV